MNRRNNILAIMICASLTVAILGFTFEFDVKIAPNKNGILQMERPSATDGSVAGAFDEDVMPTLLTLNVDDGETPTKTSGSVGSQTSVEACVIYDGGSGSAIVSYREVFDNGTTSVVHQTSYSSPWFGCAGPPTSYTWTFTNDSKLRVQVHSNTGIAFQVQADHS